MSEPEIWYREAQNWIYFTAEFCFLRLSTFHWFSSKSTKQFIASVCFFLVISEGKSKENLLEHVTDLPRWTTAKNHAWLERTQTFIADDIRTEFQISAAIWKFLQLNYQKICHMKMLSHANINKQRFPFSHKLCNGL